MDPQVVAVLALLTYLVGMLCVEAYDPRRRRRERVQHAETPGERYRRNLDLIDHARITLVDNAQQHGRK